MSSRTEPVTVDHGLEGRAGAPGAVARERAVTVWLIGVALLVFAMIVLGGATRLTDSGLSITEWQPILGVIPPLTEAQWHEAFERYRQIPEYHILNQGMSLAEFQFIYWWEWSHRFLGRIIGLAFALPLAVFWLSGALRPGMKAKLVALLGLGALQGVIGWYMVKSGLIDRVDVSPYRLALHLSVAFAIFGFLIWLVLDLGGSGATGVRLEGRDTFRRTAMVIVALVFLQIVLGAFVAGTKAGLLHNTWPLMDGKLVPDGLGAMQPWYLNLFENLTTVQFNHRMAAYVVAAVVLGHVFFVLRSGATGPVRTSAVVLGIAVLAQIGLGIWTLLAAAPLSLALAHQAGAAVLFGIAVWHWHRVS